MLSTLLLVGFALGLDNLRIAVGLGMLRLSHQRRIQIALAFWFCESLTPLLGLAFGNLLVDSIYPLVDRIGPIMLGTAGLYVIYQALIKDEADQPFDYRWMILSLPLSLSLDNLFAGIGLGMLHLPILLSAIVIGAISGLLSMLGLLIGGAVTRYLPTRAELLSGFILFALAVAVVAGN